MKWGFAALAALFWTGAASAEPPSCAPHLVNAGVAGSPEEARARLACDLDRAQLIAQKADTLHDPDGEAFVQIIESNTRSGAAYVYSIRRLGDAFMLTARSVPEAAAADNQMPVCALTETLPQDDVRALARLLALTANATLPAYGRREEMVTGADGTKRVQLVLDAQDIVTVITTLSGAHHYSRHSRDTSDAIGALNAHLLKRVAQSETAWTCEPLSTFPSKLTGNANPP